MRLPHRRTKRRRNWALGDQQGEAGTHVASRATLALRRSISSRRQLLSPAPALALLQVFRENSRNSRCIQLKLCEVCAVLVLCVVHVAGRCVVSRLCDIIDFRAVPVVSSLWLSSVWVECIFYFHVSTVPKPNLDCHFTPASSFSLHSCFAHLYCFYESINFSKYYCKNYLIMIEFCI